MSNFTFLTKEQCFGDGKLDIFKKIGPEGAMTDFSILHGGVVSRDHVHNDSSLKGRAGCYWTKSEGGREGWLFQDPFWVSDNAFLVMGDGSSYCYPIRLGQHWYWGTPSFAVLINRFNPHERKECEKSKRWYS